MRICLQGRQKIMPSRIEKVTGTILFRGKFTSFTDQKCAIAIKKTFPCDWLFHLGTAWALLPIFGCIQGHSPPKRAVTQFYFYRGKSPFVGCTGVVVGAWDFEGRTSIPSEGGNSSTLSHFLGGVLWYYLCNPNFYLCFCLERPFNTAKLHGSL